MAASAALKNQRTALGYDHADDRKATGGIEVTDGARRQETFDSKTGISPRKAENPSVGGA
jgi:hypothetical protein